ncbi:hypothetical protein BaRGS_00002450 [Batillaria attramentaria]|uniref:Uncharacterized protein n=1 Tax=Batillaria attramentaria TaxID=370345 RepID=A0ABD0M4K0_9CAEN
MVRLGSVSGVHGWAMKEIHSSKHSSLHAHAHIHSHSADSCGVYIGSVTVIIAVYTRNVLVVDKTASVVTFGYYLTQMHEEVSFPCFLSQDMASAAQGPQAYIGITCKSD